MSEPFSILQIPSDARRDVEQLGSKPKFWFVHEGENWLFKEARENTGEDWSEKVASEIAALLELPTHHTELANWQGKPGSAVRSFLSAKSTVLVHGNELTDDSRERRLQENGLERYIRNGRGGIFLRSDVRHGLSPLLVAEMLAQRFPEFFRPWQTRVAALSVEQFSELLDRVPKERMSDAARSFTFEFLCVSRQLILKML